MTVRASLNATVIGITSSKLYVPFTDVDVILFIKDLFKGQDKT